jgi:Flp pilus assembly protein TadD
MKMRSLARLVLVFVAVTVLVPLLSSQTSSLYAQNGNSINGMVFGLERRPLSDVHVELLDELSRTIARTRTNASGRYIFNGLGPGRYGVRVMPFEIGYEEQEQTVEISNFSRSDGAGGTRLTGFQSVQLDIYLRPRKGNETTGPATAIFVQTDIPEQAKTLYEKGIKALDEKKDLEAFEHLKAALEIFPKYYAALERLGTEYIRLGYFEAAQVLLTLAVDVNPRGFKSWYGLSYSLYSLKRIGEASKAAEKALELNSASAEALLLSGVLLRQQGRIEEAQKQLLKAKQFSNDRLPEVHRQLALLYVNNLKRYRDAVRELKLYLKVQPNASDAEGIKKLIKELEKKAEES